MAYLKVQSIFTRRIRSGSITNHKEEKLMSLLTKSGGILGPIATVLGYIMSGIFAVLVAIHIPNMLQGLGRTQQKGYGQQLTILLF